MSQASISKRTLTAEILKIDEKADYVNKLKANVVESLMIQRDAILNDSKTGLHLDEDIENIQREARDVLPEYIRKQSALHKYKTSIDNIQGNLKTIDDELNALQLVHEKTMMQLLEKKQFFEDRLQSIDNMDKTIGELEENIYQLGVRHGVEMAELQKERQLVMGSTVGSPSEIELGLEAIESKMNEMERRHAAQVSGMSAQIRGLKGDISENLENIRSDKDQLASDIHKLEVMKLRATPSAMVEMEKQTKEAHDRVNEYNRIVRMSNLTIQEKRRRLLELRGLRMTPSGRILTGAGQLYTMAEAKKLGLVDGIDDSILLAPDSSSESSLTESVTSTETSMSGLSSLDSHYLKSMLGKPLTLALAEIAAKQPRDPIHYLGHWLFKYRYNQETDDAKKRELDELLAERRRLALIELRKRAENEAKQTLMDLLGRMEIEVERRAIEAELKRIEEEAAAQAAENEEMEFEAQDTLGIYDGPSSGQKMY